MRTLAAANPDADVLRVASALGFLAFFCLAATVVWGMATALGPWAGRVRGDALELGHLAWSVAGLTLVAGHVLAHTLRPAGAYTWAEALVPFARGGVTAAAGIVAWLALVAAAVAFAARSRLGAWRWTLVHRAAYGGFVLMAAHVVLAADEVHRMTWLGIASAAVIAALAGLVALRWWAAARDAAVAAQAAAWGLDP